MLPSSRPTLTEARMPGPVSACHAHVELPSVPARPGEANSMWAPLGAEGGEHGGDWTRHGVVDCVKLLRKPERSISMRRSANLPSQLSSGMKREQSCNVPVLGKLMEQLLPAAISSARDPCLYA